MDLGKISHDFFLDDAHHHAADVRSPDRAQAANNGHEQDLDAVVKPKHSIRMDESGIARKNSAGNAGKRSSHSVRLEFVGERIDPSVSGAVFVLINGHQSKPELVLRNKQRDRHRQRSDQERRVVMLGLAERT